MVTRKAKGIKEVKVPLKKPRPAKVKAVVENVPVMASVGVAATSKFLSAVGRRKTARARVRMTETGRGAFIVNGKELNKFFSQALAELVVTPLKLTGQDVNHDFSVKVSGGGSQGQAEAVRHGLARVLVKWSEDYRKPLKRAGYLKRDPREKERKKPGLKKARRAPQWAKR